MDTAEYYLPDYSLFTSELEALGLLVDASEAHGLVSGLVCSAADVDTPTQIAGMFSDFGLGEEEMNRLVDLLTNLFILTRAHLHEADFTFQLLLPEEEAGIGARTEALAAWCRGLVYGLVEGGVGDPTALPGHPGEVVRDLIEIAEAEPDTDASDEEEERALMELEEYVRVGVQLIFEELTVAAPPGEPDPFA